MKIFTMFMEIDDKQKKTLVSASSIEKNPSLTITWQVVQAQDFSHACSMDMPLESAALRMVSPSEASIRAPFGQITS